MGRALIVFILCLIATVLLSNCAPSKIDVSGRVDIVVGLDFDGLREFVEQMCETADDPQLCIDENLNQFFQQATAGGAHDSE